MTYCIEYFWQFFSRRIFVAFSIVFLINLLLLLLSFVNRWLSLDYLRIDTILVWTFLLNLRKSAFTFIMRDIIWTLISIFKTWTCFPWILPVQICRSYLFLSLRQNCKLFLNNFSIFMKPERITRFLKLLRELIFVGTNILKLLNFFILMRKFCFFLWYQKLCVKCPLTICHCW